jgi:arylsulfatase A
MRRRDFLTAAAAGRGALGRPAARPNFIFMLADDLGYGDVDLSRPGAEAFRNPYVKTPHLAELARQSVLFTHHYAASTVCSPSRAGLLTGRTPSRSNVDLWINDLKDDDRMFLSGKAVTIPELLKRGGYETAIFGKWHLNGANWEDRSNWTGWTGSFPKQQGFDHGLVTKENPLLNRDLKLNSQENPGDYFHLDGTPAGTIRGFSSQIIADAAIDWLKNGRDRNKPFFLYLPFDAVHEIISSPGPFAEMYQTGDANKDKYYANVSFLDAQVGRVVAAVDAMGLGGDTVVFFSSDNGPDILRGNTLTERSYGTSYPLFGHKRQLFEGGIRVPGMVRWPGRIKPRVSDFPNVTLDVLPTLAQLASVPLPEDLAIDGISLTTHLLEGARPRRKLPLYWHFEKQARMWATIGEGYNRRQDGQRPTPDPVPHVVIRRDYYALRGYKTGKPFALPERYELYDVVRDPQERRELSKVNPALFRSMVEELEAMHLSVMRDREIRAREIGARVDQRS